MEKKDLETIQDALLCAVETVERIDPDHQELETSEAIELFEKALTIVKESADGLEQGETTRL